MRTTQMRVWLRILQLLYPSIVLNMPKELINTMNASRIYPTYKNEMTSRTKIDGGTKKSTFYYLWNPVLDIFSIQYTNKEGKDTCYVFSLKRIKQGLLAGVCKEKSL